MPSFVKWSKISFWGVNFFFTKQQEFLNNELILCLDADLFCGRELVDKLIFYCANTLLSVAEMMVVWFNLLLLT